PKDPDRESRRSADGVGLAVGGHPAPADGRAVRDGTARSEGTNRSQPRGPRRAHPLQQIRLAPVSQRCSAASPFGGRGARPARRPPGAAVGPLALPGGAEPAPLLALWEAADRPPAVDAPAPHEGPGRWLLRLRRPPLTALALIVTVATVSMTLVTAHRSGAPG